MALGSASQGDHHVKPTHGYALQHPCRQFSSRFNLTNGAITHQSRTPREIDVSDDGTDDGPPQKKFKITNSILKLKSSPEQPRRADLPNERSSRTTLVNSSARKSIISTQISQRDVSIGAHAQNSSAPTVSKKRPQDTDQRKSDQYCIESRQQASSSTPIPRPAFSKKGNGTRIIPFLIDDCSPIETPLAKVLQTAKPVSQALSRATGLNVVRKPDAQREKEFQRLQSLRMRQEAENRKNNSERSVARHGHGSADLSTGKSSASLIAHNENRENSNERLKHEASPHRIPAIPGKLSGLSKRHLPNTSEAKAVPKSDSHLTMIEDDESIDVTEISHGKQGHQSEKAVASSGNTSKFIYSIAKGEKRVFASSDTPRDVMGQDVLAVKPSKRAERISDSADAHQTPRESRNTSHTFQSLVPTDGCKTSNPFELRIQASQSNTESTQLETRDYIDSRITDEARSSPLLHSDPKSRSRSEDERVGDAMNTERSRPKICGVSSQIEITQARKSPTLLKGSAIEKSRCTWKNKLSGNHGNQSDTTKPWTSSADSTERRKQSIVADLERETESKRRVALKKAQQQQQFLEREQTKAEERQRAIRHEEELNSRKYASSAQRTALEILSAAKRTSVIPEDKEDPIKTSSSTIKNGYDKQSSKKAPAIAIEEAQKRREERVKAKLRANERRRQAEARELQLEKPRNTPEDLESQVSNVTLLDPSTPKDCLQFNASLESMDVPGLSPEESNHAVESPKTQPFSLNSVAGQSAIGKDLLSSQQAPARRTHKRRLGEILPQDMKILKWKKQGMKFSEMETSFSQAFGVNRKACTLQKRYRVVRDALKVAKVPRDVIDLGEEGVEEARLQLNSIVERHFKNESTEETIPIGAKPQHITENLVETQLHSHPLTPSAGEVETTGFEISTHVAPPHSSKNPEILPQVAGKTMNEATFQHYLQIIAEERAERDSDQDDDSSVTSSVDLCCFKYQVVRRELTAEELADGQRIEDQQFCLCGLPSDSIVEANRKATSQIFRVSKGSPGVGAKKHQLDTEHDDDGLVNLELAANEWGVVQVRVVKYVQACGEGSLRPRAAKLAPRKVYLVKESRIRKIGEDCEDLFGEAQETTISEKTLDNSVFTALELANERAIEDFVRLTYKSTSANLTIRQTEMQAKKNEWIEWLEEQDEGTLFYANAEVDDTTSIEVKVEEGKLSGPRNIWS